MTHTQPERLRCEVCDMPTLGDTLCNLHYEEQEKMTHTPGPWTSDGMANDMMEFRIYSPTGRVIAKIQDFTTFREDVEQAEANVAYIVRACNSHEAMLEALKACVSYIQQAEDDEQANAIILLPDSATLAAAKEAIRLAEGRGEHDASS